METTVEKESFKDFHADSENDIYQRLLGREFDYSNSQYKERADLCLLKACSKMNTSLHQIIELMTDKVFKHHKFVFYSEFLHLL